MDVRLNCPNCQGSVVLHARVRYQGPLLGRCETCDSTYSLSAGRLSPVAVVPERAPGPSFLSRLDAGRRRLLGRVPPDEAATG